MIAGAKHSPRVFQLWASLAISSSITAVVNATNVLPNQVLQSLMPETLPDLGDRRVQWIPSVTEELHVRENTSLGDSDVVAGWESEISSCPAPREPTEGCGGDSWRSATDNIKGKLPISKGNALYSFY